MATQIGEPGSLDLHFPIAGLDLKDAFHKQKARQVAPGMWARSTPSCKNVVGFDTGDRVRGGSRRGLVRHIETAVVASWVIQHLATVVYKDADATG